jgi:spore coat polysaccharide biosynthesis protein SpsF (cytidylyltransferase family)
MEKIFDEFYSLASPLPDLEKVIHFLDTRPDISQINADTPQKNWQS